MLVWHGKYKFVLYLKNINSLHVATTGPATNNDPHENPTPDNKRPHINRQCTVNEAYNLLYCGRFEDAKIVLKELWNSCGPDDQVTRNQCRSAWLLGKRLKRTARKLDRYRHDVSTGNSKKNLDDYQRIRLVC